MNAREPASRFHLTSPPYQRLLARMPTGRNFRYRARSAAIGCYLVVAATTNALAYSIEWEVLNRFTLFDDLRNSDLRARAKRSADLFAKYSYQVQADKNLADEDLGPVRAAYEQARWTLGSPFDSDLPPERTWWNERDGRYWPGYFQRPEYVLLRIKLQPQVSSDCEWIVGDHRVTQPCSAKFETAIKNTESIPVSVLSHGQPVIETSISVGHRIILGLGDSYASGEGNPDRPTRWLPQPALRSEPGSVDEKQFDWPSRTVKSGPVWLSRRCHRSFWSWQLQAALWQASADRHSIITFGGYSCSGAEVWDGILARQSGPPGVYKRCKNESSRLSNGCLVPLAQISAAVMDLCAPVLTERDKSITPLPAKKYWKDVGKVAPVKRIKCPIDINTDGRVERILLSIGGNDIGFSKVIAWSLIPTRPRELAVPLVGYFLDRFAKAKLWNEIARSGEAVCPSDQASKSQKTFGKCDVPSAEQRLKSYLSVRAYPDLDRELRLAFGKQAPAISIVRYMNPLMEADGKRLCGEQLEPLESRLNIAPGRQSAWDGVVSVLGDSGTDAKAWGVNLFYGEARLVHGGLLEPLVRVDYPEGWKAIGGHQGSFLTHGWCASREANPSKDKDFLYPSWYGRWTRDGIEPTKWSPFKPRQRWFRTASDSVLTQYESDGRLGGAINGVLHPTAQGHAAIADAVVANW